MTCGWIMGLGALDDAIEPEAGSDCLVTEMGKVVKTDAPEPKKRVYDIFAWTKAT